MASNPNPPSLSKSRFIAGRQCHKRLWLEVNRPTERDEVDDSAQAIFKMGTEIGEWARKLYPEGVLISDGPQERNAAIESTRLAIESGATAIFEAAAEGAGGFCRADILVKAGSQWDLLEVKSSSGHESEYRDVDDVDVYLWDIAHQRVVFEASGYSIRRTCLVLVNRDYVRNGDIDVQRLFVIEDRTAEVSERLNVVRQQLIEFGVVAGAESLPTKEIGVHCFDPYDCPFQGTCWRDVPEYSVFNLKLIRKNKAFELYHAGKRLPEDVPAEKLTDFQALQVEVKRSGKSYVDKPALKMWLSTLVYPIRHLDFETMNPAIPVHQGTRPYDRQPFQYSVHLQMRRGADPAHSEYLPNHRNDPRRELLERLIHDLGGEGTILAFNAGFEKGVLRELAVLFPEHQMAVNGILGRVLDLATPFSKGWLIHPGFKGRYSMKVVLPALVPEMSYENLGIGDGGAASAAWVEYLDSATPRSRQDAIRADLLVYCGQDTLGMVRVLDHLYSIGLE